MYFGWLQYHCQLKVIITVEITPITGSVIGIRNGFVVIITWRWKVLQKRTTWKVVNSSVSSCNRYYAFGPVIITFCVMSNNLQYIFATWLCFEENICYLMTWKYDSVCNLFKHSSMSFFFGDIEGLKFRENCLRSNMSKLLSSISHR